MHILYTHSDLAPYIASNLPSLPVTLLPYKARPLQTIVQPTISQTRFSLFDHRIFHSACRVILAWIPSKDDFSQPPALEDTRLMS